MRNFASDNATPAAPEVLAAIAAANRGTAHSYGEDEWTARFTEAARRLFGKPDLVVFPVATGTAANALALSVLAPGYGAVFCHEHAHIATDECGAPEFYTGGAKLLGFPGAGGKLRADAIGPAVRHAAEMGVHTMPPAAVSITQSTEWGTVYTPEELAALAEAAHGNGLTLHMDGARFANAMAHLGCTPAEASWRAGVDALSLGGTKNGALAAEAVVFFDPTLAAGFAYRRKRAGQLWSKFRFLSAQLLALFEDGLWLRHGAHANAMARRIGEGLASLPGVRLLEPVEANEVFAVLPARVAESLRADGFEFYDWPFAAGAIRLVTSYATEAEAVDALVGAVARYSN